MKTKISPHLYHHSSQKKVLDFVGGIFLLVAFFPLFILISILIKLSSKGPGFFTQERVGENGKVFNFIKFRTMRVGAEQERAKFMHLNEADGPVFKIRDDPRFTKFGKILARTGLDELPQLINVLKGEMSLVGPRPFPVAEAKKLTKSQKIRELVKPGITSSWVVKGAHNLKFKEWMKLDKEYVLNASPRKDFEILLKTSLMIIQLILKHLLKPFNG